MPPTMHTPPHMPPSPDVHAPSPAMHALSLSMHVTSPAIHTPIMHAPLPSHAYPSYVPPRHAYPPQAMHIPQPCIPLPCTPLPSHACPPLIGNRMTDRCKNITFPQTSFEVGNKNLASHLRKTFLIFVHTLAFSSKLNFYLRSKDNRRSANLVSCFYSFLSNTCLFWNFPGYLKEQ